MQAIYLRVSSNHQDTRSQEADLRAWAARQEADGETVTWYRDKASGTNFNRRGWQRLETDLGTGKVSRLAVWRLDRLGRTAGETIQLLDNLEARGIGFLSLRDGFDPSTPSGRLQRNILASVAQVESEVRKERQLAGIAAAREANNGKCPWGGRKPGTRVTLTEEKEALACKLKAEGQSVAAIARTLGIARKTVYVALGRQPASAEES
jgi:DNA invertase Pin-like site-specific DNA recombinase